MIFWVLWMSGIAVCHAQQREVSGMFYRAWQTAEGLPDNSVTGVVQSPDGYLFVGTEAGLTRFNGTSLTGISLRNFQNVRNRAVRAMFIGRQGQLWLGMERGPLIRVGRNGSRVFTEADGLFPQRTLGISDDGAGAVWVAYQDGLCRITDDSVVRFTEKEGLPSGNDTWIGKAGSGELWFQRGSKVGFFRDGQFQTQLDFGESRVSVGVGKGQWMWLVVGRDIMKFREGEDPQAVARLPDDVEAKVVLEDDSGALWIGSIADGLFRIFDGVVKKVPTSNQDIDCVSQDREGNLWVGTNGGGLNLIRSRVIALIGKSAGLPFHSVISVCEDAAGGICVVGQNGDLVRNQGNGWQPVEGLHGKANCVAADVASGIWVGTRNHGLRYLKDGKWRGWTTAEGLVSQDIRSILTASNGDVWIAMDSPSSLQLLRGGELTRIAAEGEIGAIPAMTEAADGTIWIGTDEGRILRVRDGMLTEEPAIAEDSPMPVRALLTTPDGSLWIGYGGDGLGWFKDGRYARVTTAEGLMDDYISQLLTDGRGSLWAAANRGIFQMDLEALNAVVEGRSKWVPSRIYGEGEGLPGLQPSRDHFPSACVGKDGQLWFSMKNGLVVTQPERIAENLEPPEVLLERVTLNDEPAALYGNRALLQRVGKGRVLDLSVPNPVLRVPPGHEKLRFDFAALSYASPENVRFRYQLRGFDRGWIEADTMHSATYPPLPAGKYEFQVTACNNAGVWNTEGARLALVVSPFFWETWWFRIGGGVASIGAVGWVVYMSQRRKYRQRLRKVAERRAIEEERARIARDIHDDLGASLTRILLLSRPVADSTPTDTQAVLPQIHDTSRDLIRSMGEVVWAVNPEQDSFDALADYLSNYAQSFLGLAGIRCRLEMPLELPNRFISAQVRHNLFLAFKEALNNVVKYAGATEVRVSLGAEETRIILQVEDDGRGIDEDAGFGHGLANMRRRMEEIGGTCDVSDGEVSGTRVKFEVQLKKSL